MDFQPQQLDGLNKSLSDFLGDKIGGSSEQNPKINPSSFQVNRYFEKGFYSISSFNDLHVQSMKVLLQQPSASVIVKKKMFSSLAEYERPEFLDPDEKLFIRASKYLFKNKAKQIAYYEQLTKVNQVLMENGGVIDLLLPVVIGAVDGLSSLISATGNSSSALSQTKKFLDQIKQAYFFNNPSLYTTWVSENASISSNLINDAFANETGVLEFTNFASLSTHNSIHFGNGSVSVEFADPYNCMLITEEDIELAMSDATSSIYNSSFFNSSMQQLQAAVAQSTAILNQIRRARGVSTITFKQYPKSATNPVIAIMDRTETQIYFEKSNDLLAPNISVDGSFLNNNSPDAFTDDEVRMFAWIIKSIIDYVASQVNYQANMVSNNIAGSALRRKMYDNYLSKSIIQPTDVVNVFINSRTRYDNTISNSMQSGFNMLQLTSKLQSDFNDLQGSFQNIFDSSQNINLQLEKSVYASADFPTYLWLLFRNYFVGDRDGCGVFTGIVEKSGSSFNEGQYSARLSGKTNSGYFEMGQVAFNPGVSTDNGALFDPRTPYKTKSDQVYSNFNNDLELLDENKTRLRTGTLRFKEGPLKGHKANSDNLVHDRLDKDRDNGSQNKVAFLPDGIIYQWKQGIGIAVQNGVSVNNDPSRTGSTNIFKEPFENQDVFNSLALLITGKPYDYVKFYSNAIDPASEQIQPFIQNLQTELYRRNTMWGNFQQYKTFNNNEAQSAALVLSRLSIQKKYDDVNSLLNDLASVQSIANQSSGDLTSYVPQQVAIKMQSISADLKRSVDDINKNVKDNKSIIFNGNNAAVTSLDTNPNMSRQLRRKTNEYTRRLAWKVRANKDPNLLIVEDTMDKDSDITAFAKDITQATSMYSSAITTVQEKIRAVAGILDLEIFCDTQGHIRLRAPQYNRVPSSVFFRLMQRKSEEGVQLYPEFLNTLITNKIQYITQKLEVEEDYIRLLGAIMGYQTDSDCATFIGSTNKNGDYSSNRSNGFTFLSTAPESPTSTSILDLSSVFKSSDDINVKLDALDTSLASIKAEADNSNVFDVGQQANVVSSFFAIDPKNPSNTNISRPDLTNLRINAIEQNILSKSGKTVNLDDYLNVSANGITVSSKKSTVNIVKIVQEIALHVGNRQNLTKQLQGVLKNYRDSINVNNSKSAQADILFQKSNNREIPEMFENLIEDESYDDLGPGSGARFVIEPEHIISFESDENPPEYTHVCVSGILGGFESNTLDTGNFSNLGQGGGGNAITTADAVDYTMWRMYGHMSSMTVKKPYFSDGKKHCAPYAAMLLNRIRRNILVATATVVGNEYYQPGEVVYVRHRNLLYYIEAVSHRFSWGEFSTSLVLSYGHAPGVYIPNPFDMIGKMLYNNKYGDDLTIFTENNATNQTVIGALVNYTTDQTSEYNENNKKVLDQLLSQISLFVNGANMKTDDQIIIPRVELRIFGDSHTALSSQPMSVFANNIKSYLTGNRETIPYIPGKDDKRTTLPEKDPVKNEDIVKIVTIDFADKTNVESPSRYAHHYAEAFSKHVNTTDTLNDLYIQDSQTKTQLNGVIPQGAPDNTKDYDTRKIALIKYVMDVAVVFESESLIPLG